MGGPCLYLALGFFSLRLEKRCGESLVAMLIAACQAAVRDSTAPHPAACHFTNELCLSRITHKTLVVLTADMQGGLIAGGHQWQQAGPSHTSWPSVRSTATVETNVTLTLLMLLQACPPPPPTPPSGVKGRRAGVSSVRGGPANKVR